MRSQNSKLYKVLWTALILAVSISGGYAAFGPPSLILCVVMLASFASEFINGAFGMGYGTILAPVLIWLGFNPLQAVFGILATEMVSGWAAGFFHNSDKNIDFSNRQNLQTTAILCLGCVLGAFVGVPTAMRLPREALILATGAVIVLSALFILVFMSEHRPYRIKTIFGLSILSAFNKSLTGGGFGPLLTSWQIIGGVSGKSAAAITAIAKAVTGVVGVGLYLSKSLKIEWPLLWAIASGALLSVPVATGFVKRFEEKHIKLMVGVVTVVLGLVTVYKGIK